jgi:hypothetical protein
MTSLQDWAPGIDEWPGSWMGVAEDLEYGVKLLPYMKEFLEDLLNQGIARRTFVGYRDNVWGLGGTIIKQVSWDEEYGADPLKKLMESVEADGVLPDDFDQMSEDELHSFERMCRRFEKFLLRAYGASGVFSV